MTKKTQMALDVFGGWLIPGFGYFRRGRYARAAILFVVIEGTFLMGLALRGGVTSPIVEASGGGVISLLTFVIQLGAGLMSVFSYGANLWKESLVESGMEPGSFIRFFSGKPTNAYFELGGFYLLVAGAMNYFIVTNYYDRYGEKKKGETEGEAKKDGKPA